MSKQPQTESQALCVHCQVHPADTEDHWFPKSWYPSSTPVDLEKFTFPSCWQCNQRCGQVEDRLHSRLALALDPLAGPALGVADSARRSMTPKRGRNERDRRARLAHRAHLMRESFSAESVPAHSILPGLGPAGNVPLGQQVAILVSAADLQAFAEKLVRGLTYLQCGLLISPAYEIAMQLLAPENVEIFTSELDRFGTCVDRGPGIRARVARTADDPIIAMYEFTIWERLTMFAYVRPQGHE